MTNKPLSIEEERNLSERMILNGDQDARMEFIERNRCLVYFIAKRYFSFKDTGLDVEDIIQEGMVGLVEAVNRFKLGTGAKFSTMAVYWIKKYIQMAISSKSRTVKLPRNSFDDMTNVRRTVRNMRSEGMMTPTREAVAEEIGMSIEQIDKLFDSFRDNAHVGETDFKTGDFNGYIAEGTDDTEDIYDQKERIEYVNAILKQNLDLREYTVIKGTFGLEETLPRTLDELGLELGISRERVRQIKESVLLKMETVQELMEAANE